MNHGKEEIAIACRWSTERVGHVAKLCYSPAVMGLVLVLTAGVVLSSAGCQRKAPAGAAPAAPPPPKVMVSNPVEMPLVETRDYTGHLEAVESVAVRARVRGVLEKIHFEEGAEVEVGTLLYEIDPREFQAVVDEMAADIERLNHELKRTQLAAERSTELLAKNATSREEWETKQAAKAVTKAQMEKAKASLEVAKLNLSYTKIHAPISGRVGRTLVTVGNLVGYNEPTLLTTIVRMDPVYIQFEIPERDLLRFEAVDQGSLDATWSLMRAPLSVGLETETGYPHEGVIDFRDNRVDAETGTILVRGTLANRERKLVPGLFARVRVPVGLPKPRLLVPQTALAADQRGRYALVVKADDTVEQRPVQIAANVEQKGYLPIREGLNRSDRVIVSGLQRARPGAKVAPQLVNPDEFARVAGKDVAGQKASQ